MIIIIATFGQAVAGQGPGASIFGGEFFRALGLDSIRRVADADFSFSSQSSSFGDSSWELESEETTLSLPSSPPSSLLLESVDE